MNPLLPTFVDVLYGVVAIVCFVLAVVALVMVWREEAEERDIPRAIVLSVVTLFVPLVGAIVTIVNVKRHKKIHVEQ